MLSKILDCATTRNIVHCAALTLGNFLLGALLIMPWVHTVKGFVCVILSVHEALSKGS